MTVFCANPKAQYLPYKDEIDAAILRVLDSGTYILGEQVSLFEREFAEYLGADFAVGCGSGTDALVLALKALGIGFGDEVIVPSHTAVPTVSAVQIAGAVPVYVDVESDFFTVDADQIEAACTDKTKAIIAVHLYGQAADIDRLVVIAEKLGLKLIEDCAHSTGASFRGEKLGTIGDAGCFSFFPTKNLGCIGDGGAVTCKDESIAERVRRIRQYGWDENRVSIEPGINSRLDELQAAVLRVKLRHLDSDNAVRQEQASRYDEVLASLPVTIPVKREGSSHVFHLYVIETENRDDLIQFLRKYGIVLGIHYPVPVHRMGGFPSEACLPVTDHIVDRIVTLPLYPGFAPQEQDLVIDSIKRYYSSK